MAKRRAAKKRRKVLRRVTKTSGSLRCTKCRKRTIGGVNGRKRHMRKVHEQAARRQDGWVPPAKRRRKRNRKHAKSRFGRVGIHKRGNRKYMTYIRNGKHHMSLLRPGARSAKRRRSRDAYARTFNIMVDSIKRNNPSMSREDAEWAYRTSI